MTPPARRHPLAPLDPKLLRRAGALLTFLRSPRTSEQIRTWARDRCMAEHRVDELFRHLTEARLVRGAERGRGLTVTWCSGT